MEGYKLALPLIILAVLFQAGGYTVIGTAGYAAGAIFSAAAVFTLYFFRDPERRCTKSDGDAVSPADGVVIDVCQMEEKGFPDGRALRIAVFMNVFNVHVNRTPLKGAVTETRHRNGKKLSAYNRRAEYENEHGDTDINTIWGLIRIRQIAGLIARRVVTRVKKGDFLERGGRIGLIRFGSRVDVFFPLCFEPLVVLGQRVRAGETIIAREKNPAKESKL